MNAVLAKNSDNGNNNCFLEHLTFSYHYFVLMTEGGFVTSPAADLIRTRIMRMMIMQERGTRGQKITVSISLPILLPAYTSD